MKPTSSPCTVPHCPRRKGGAIHDKHACRRRIRVGILARRDAVMQSLVLSRLVKATTARAMAPCPIQPANARLRKVTFAIPYSATLKQINDSGATPIDYCENSQPFGMQEPARLSPFTSFSARSP
jgi:hypothetical protein